MSEQKGFFSADCVACKRRVLGRRALSEQEDGGLVWLCLHCDAPLSQRSARWLDASELEEVECFLVDELADDQKHGEHGGCRDGACGVSQPGAPA